MLTPEQIENRKTGIGGSDISNILTGSEELKVKLPDWKTPLEVYKEKIGEFEEEDITSNRYLQKQRYFDVGNKVEPYLRSYYEKATGHKVEHTDVMRRCEANPFMIANIDGYVRSEDVIVEFKKANNFMKKYWGDEGTDEVPPQYLFQGSHYSCVWKPKRVDIVVSFLDETAEEIILKFDHPETIEFLISRDFRIYHYYPQPQLEQHLVEKAKDFWFNNVISRVPPPPINARDAIAMFPIDDKKVKIATDEELEIVMKFQNIKEKIKTYQESEKDYKKDILLLLEGAAILLDKGGEKLLSCTHSNVLNEEAFKKEHPELFAKHSKLDKTSLKKEEPILYGKFTEKSKSPTLRMI